jgi:glutamate-1-semialdehyde 2,1-aminomutase
MLDAAIYLPPSQFEANFISIAHEKEDLDRTVEAVRKALEGIS